MSFFIPVAGMLLWVACQNDSNSEGVQEIRNTDGPNASIVRNPVSADGSIDTNALAQIKFEEPIHDFGTVNEGDIVEHRFKFTNTGKVALTILDAKSSCGCTVPEWPDDPIPPGSSGEIVAKFNTEMKPNKQKKNITVTANTYPNETKVTLTGMVTPKEK
jgi:hypothetical protein